MPLLLGLPGDMNAPVLSTNATCSNKALHWFQLFMYCYIDIFSSSLNLVYERFLFWIVGLNFIPVIEEALYRRKVTIRTQSFISITKWTFFCCLFLPYFASAMILSCIGKTICKHQYSNKGSFTGLSVSESTLKSQSIHSISDVINLSIVLKG